MGSVALGILAVAVPKCPLCYTAYCGAVGALAFARISWRDGILWTLLLLVIAGFVYRAGRAVTQRSYVSLGLAGTGATVLMTGKVVGESASGLVYAGVALLVASAFWEVLPRKHISPPKVEGGTGMGSGPVASRST